MDGVSARTTVDRGDPSYSARPEHKRQVPHRLDRLSIGSQGRTSSPLGGWFVDPIRNTLWPRRLPEAGLLPLPRLVASRQRREARHGCGTISSRCTRRPWCGKEAGWRAGSRPMTGTPSRPGTRWSCHGHAKGLVAGTPVAVLNAIWCVWYSARPVKMPQAETRSPKGAVVHENRKTENENAPPPLSPCYVDPRGENASDGKRRPFPAPLCRTQEIPLRECVVYARHADV